MRIVYTELTVKEILKLGEAFDKFAVKNKNGTFKKRDKRVWEFINSLNPIDK